MSGHADNPKGGSFALGLRCLVLAVPQYTGGYT